MSSILSQYPKKNERWTELGPFRIFRHFCHKTSKNEGGPFDEKNRPVLYVALKKGTSLLVKFLGPNGPI